MAWREMLDMLLKKGRYEDMDRDPFEEGGEEEESMSSRKKAEVARDRILVRQGSGPEAEARYVRSAEYQIPKKTAKDEVERRRILAELKKRYKLASHEDAEALLEEFGGVNAFLEKHNLATPEERSEADKTLRELAERKRLAMMGID